MCCVLREALRVAALKLSLDGALYPPPSGGRSTTPLVHATGGERISRNTCNTPRNTVEGERGEGEGHLRCVALLRRVACVASRPREIVACVARKINKRLS